MGVVFSVTILALTLASQQFGPRMMRNFIRDLGNQVTLGVFVATFVYSVLGLGSMNSYRICSQASRKKLISRKIWSIFTLATNARDHIYCIGQPINAAF